jgi:hypothetical protein
MPIAAMRTNVNMAIRFTLDSPESVGLADFLPFDIRLLQPATIADDPHRGDAKYPKGEAALVSTIFEFGICRNYFLQTPPTSWWRVEQQLLGDFGTIH